MLGVRQRLDRPSRSSSNTRVRTRKPGAKGRTAGRRPAPGRPPTPAHPGSAAARRSTAPGPRRSRAGAGAPRHRRTGWQPASGDRRALSRGPLPPCAARVTRTPSTVPSVTALAAFGVRQEPVGAVQRHERPAERRRARRDAAPMQVADAVRRAGPPDRVVQQLVVAQPPRPHLAGAGAARMRAVTARSQPAPRRSCAVSNSGSPTTLE